jgi:hypothetical protein
VLCDHFTPFVLCQLRELGLCRRDEANKDFIAERAVELGGRLPSTHQPGAVGGARVGRRRHEGVHQRAGAGG